MAAGTSQITGNIALPKIYVSTDGGTVYNQILELTEPSVPEETTDSYETTNTDITDGFKTFLPGWSDAGEVSWVVNYREDTLEQLQAVIKLSIDWRIDWTDPAHTVTDSKIEFGGFLTTHGTPQMDLEDRWTISMTIKVSGKPLFTEGTSV